MKKLHNNLLVAGQITASSFNELERAGITTIINNRPDNEEPGQFNSEQARIAAAQHNIEYHYLPMANGQPLPADLVDNFKTALEASTGNVLAHCRSGMRSSFIWALGAIADGEVTVDEAINAAQSIGIPLQNAKAVLDSVKPD